MESEPPLVIEVGDPITPKPSAGTLAIVAFYFGLLVLAFGMAIPWAGGLSTIPIQFYLKDVKHLTTSQNANFAAITAIPLYFGFLFGFLRDRFRHNRFGDQFYLFGASSLAIVIFAWLAHGEVTYTRLVVGTLASTAVFQVVNSAIQAMSAVVAQRRLLTGWLSGISTLGLTIPIAISSAIGGWLSHNVPPQRTFLVVVGITLIIVIQSIWRPRVIFDAEHAPAVEQETHWRALGRLLSNKVIWIPLIIQFLWNFAPAWGIVSTYFLADHLGFTDEGVGIWTVVQMLSFIPPVLIYCWACRRFTLGQLLWVGTLLGILQGPPLLFAHSHTAAMGAAVAFGILGGFGSAAYWDLLLRCCPKGLEGTATMLGWSLFWMASKSSDVFGARLYDHYVKTVHGSGQTIGFMVTIAVTTLAYVLIIPMLLIPRAIRDAREGDAEAVAHLP